MTQLSEKQPPVVTEEEDAPLNCDESSTSVDLLSREADVNRGLDFKRFSLGSSMLGWCIFLMFVTMLISLWNPDNALIENAFEAYKLIVMTVLGYIFGSKAA